MNPEHRITASQALRHEWISEGDVIPSLHKQTTFVRLTAFNARRKLRGVVLGLIARKRYSGQLPCLVLMARARVREVMIVKYELCYVARTFPFCFRSSLERRIC